MVRPGAVILFLAGAASTLTAQDQQLGARTKAMGGSYTAFQDDPLLVWLNPSGIARFPDVPAPLFPPRICPEYFPPPPAVPVICTTTLVAGV